MGAHLLNPYMAQAKAVPAAQFFGLSFGFLFIYLLTQQ
jgi:hypothetical protein